MDASGSGSAVGSPLQGFGFLLVASRSPFEAAGIHLEALGSGAAVGSGCSTGRPSGGALGSRSAAGVSFEEGGSSFVTAGSRFDMGIHFDAVGSRSEDTGTQLGSPFEVMGIHFGAVGPSVPLGSSFITSGSRLEALGSPRVALRPHAAVLPHFGVCGPTLGSRRGRRSPCRWSRASREPTGRPQSAPRPPNGSYDPPDPNAGPQSSGERGVPAARRRGNAKRRGTAGLLQSPGGALRDPPPSLPPPAAPKFPPARRAAARPRLSATPPPCSSPAPAAAISKCVTSGATEPASRQLPARLGSGAP